MPAHLPEVHLAFSLHGPVSESLGRSSKPFTDALYTSLRGDGIPRKPDSENPVRKVVVWFESADIPQSHTRILNTLTAKGYDPLTAFVYGEIYRETGKMDTEVNEREFAIAQSKANYLYGDMTRDLGQLKQIGNDTKVYGSQLQVYFEGTPEKELRRVTRQTELGTLDLNQEKLIQAQEALATHQWTRGINLARFAAGSDIELHDAREGRIPEDVETISNDPDVTAVFVRIGQGHKRKLLERFAENGIAIAGITEDTDLQGNRMDVHAYEEFLDEILVNYGGDVDAVPTEAWYRMLVCQAAEGYAYGQILSRRSRYNLRGFPVIRQQIRTEARAIFADAEAIKHFQTAVRETSIGNILDFSGVALTFLGIEI